LATFSFSHTVNVTHSAIVAMADFYVRELA